MMAAAVSVVAATVVLMLLWPGGQAGFQRQPAPGAPLATACLVSAVVGALIGSPLLLTTVPVAVGLVGRRLKRRALARTHTALQAAVPLMLDAAVQRLMAGSSFSVAIVEALRDEPVIGQQPAVVVAIGRIDGGGRVSDELGSMAQAIDQEWARLLAATTAVVLEGGGSGAPALDRLADTVRSHNQAAAEAAAQAGQATASAAVLGLLPLVFAAVIAAADGDARALYVQTWVGAVCLLIAVVLTAACWAVFDWVLSPTGGR